MNCKPNGSIHWILSNKNESIVVANSIARIGTHKIESNITLLSFISNQLFLSENKTVI